MALELIPIITGDGSVAVVAAQDVEVAPRRRRAAPPVEMPGTPAKTTTLPASDGSQRVAVSRRKARSHR
jgi:hypothetical protein